MTPSRPPEQSAPEPSLPELGFLERESHPSPREASERQRPPPRASVWKAVQRGLSLVYETSRGLFWLLAISTAVAGIAPAGAAWMAKVVIDATIAAQKGAPEGSWPALIAIGAEALLLLLIVIAQRLRTLGQTLLSAELAHHVHHKILEAALRLRLADFEDPDTHDQMDAARREATLRPLSLAMHTFDLSRQGLSLLGYASLLLQLSPLAVVVVVVAGLPAFIGEARFSEVAFRFFRSHTPHNRERRYLENLLTREEFKKEIGFFGLGPLLLRRYDTLFARLYAEDREVAVRRHAFGIAFSVIGLLAFFAAYAFIVIETVEGNLSLGQMTMYLVVFRQAQASVSQALAAVGGIYEDALYVDTLDGFLRAPGLAGEAADSRQPAQSTEREPRVEAGPASGLRVESVSFAYPGRTAPALHDLSFAISPAQTAAIVGPNGSGKSTLVKLLTGQYTPDRGRILLHGQDLRDWDADALRRHVSVMFQSFGRYKFTAGENIGAGDREHFDDRPGWRAAAEKSAADEVIAGLPQGYETRLGRAFRGAHELSGGQWQRIAFARALMRQSTDLLILDEPASAADPARQVAFDRRLRQVLQGRMGVVLTHHMATARLADRIVVLAEGRVEEQGSHDELMAQNGRYADLYRAQAARYG